MSPTKQRYKTRIILILGAMTTLVPFSVDSYLPAVPDIALRFGITAAEMSFALSTFFVGFAIGQLIYGPLLDRFGRKKPVYFGLVLSIISATGCLLSGTTSVFMIFRFFQALGASVATVAAITMVRDFFSQKESAKVFSMLVLVIGTSPLLAPTIGGLISTNIGWQWIFVFLSVLALFLILLVIFLLPLNYRADSRISLKIRDQVVRYTYILKQPQFIVFTISGSLSFAALFIYVAGSPVIFMQVFKVNRHMFGGIFALLAAGYIGGSQLNILMLRKYTSRQIFRFALFSQVIVASIFLTGALNGWYGIETTLVLLFASLLSLGFTSPNAMALALEPVEVNLGSASALLGTIRIGTAALATAGIGLFRVPGISPVAIMMFCAAILSLAVFTFGLRKQK